MLGRGDLGSFTFTFNGNYLARYVRQGTSADRKINFDNQFVGPRLGSFPRNRLYTSVFYDGPAGSWLGGLDAGMTVHYIGQYWARSGLPQDSVVVELRPFTRKIREWTTLDLVLNYTFNLPSVAKTKSPDIPRIWQERRYERRQR